MAGQSNTQKRIDEIQARLHEVNGELDALNLGTTPTTDLATEEANALKRLARKEALKQVSMALSVELDKLRAQLAAEQEEARQREEERLKVKMDAVHSKLTAELWSSYQLALTWEEATREFESVAPASGMKIGRAMTLVNALLNNLVVIDAVENSFGVAVTPVRLKAKA